MSAVPRQARAQSSARGEAPGVVASARAAQPLPLSQEDADLYEYEDFPQMPPMLRFGGYAPQLGDQDAAAERNHRI